MKNPENSVGFANSYTHTGGGPGGVTGASGAPELLLNDPISLDAWLFDHVTNVSQASGPQIISDYIVFSHSDAEKDVLSVSVVFSNDNFSRRYPMQYNDQKVFFLAVPVSQLYQYLSPGERDIYYRFVVDGVWVADTNNPRGVRDYRGITISITQLPERNRLLEYPLQVSGDTHFVFAPQQAGIYYISDARGQRAFVDYTRSLAVYVAGSFNGWDPYMYPLGATDGIDGAPMSETASTALSSGSGESAPRPYFHRTLQIPPGRHYYYFVINGQRILDPHNPRIASTVDGRQASLLVIE